MIEFVEIVQATSIAGIVIFYAYDFASFKIKARRLYHIMNGIIRSLKSYANETKSDYPLNMAKSLEPLVARYYEAVYIHRSRENAAAILQSIDYIMGPVISAAGRGDMNFTSDRILNRYVRLSTLYRENRYKNKNFNPL